MESITLFSQNIVSMFSWDAIIGFTGVVGLLVAIYSIRYTTSIAKKSVKPLISSWFNIGSDEISLFIKNYGSGPARIDAVEYFVNDALKDKIEDCYSLPAHIFVNKPYFSKMNKYFIGPGEKIYLFKITKDTIKMYLNLDKDHKTTFENSGSKKGELKKIISAEELDKLALDDIEDLGQRIKRQRASFKFIVSYSDTFDHPQSPYIRDYMINISTSFT